MENNNKITKVVFYEMELEGDKFFESAIFRNNKVQLENIEKGIDALQILAKEKGVKDIKTLQNTDYFEVLSEEEFEEKYPKVYNAAKCKHEDVELFHNENKNEKQEVNQEENPNELLRSLKINNLILKTSLCCIVGGIVLVGAYNIGKKLSSGNDNTENENTTTTEIEYDNTNYSHNETGYEMLQKYGSVDEILKRSDINKTKSATLSKIWSYLKNYNITISNKHESSVSDTKLAHTWDEVVVNYLAYNNINNEELIKVFDNYDIDISTFKEAYQSGYNQDLLAYTVLQEPTNKVALINSQEGKDFYQKYENLIIKYNKTYDGMYDNPELDDIANEFYQNVREDFDVNQSKESIESYKLSVIPIINAFDNMLKSIEYENLLTDTESTYFNELSSFSMIENKISNLSSNLYSYNIAVETLNANNAEYTYSQNKEEYIYTQIKDAAVIELDRKNAYNIDETDRDISDHSDYKLKFEPIKENKTQSTNNYNYNNYNYDYDTTGIINDSEPEEEIPDWMLEDNDQENTTEPENNESVVPNDDEQEDIIPDWMLDEDDQEDENNYIYDVEEDTPTNQSNDSHISDESYFEDTNNTINYDRILKEFVIDYVVDQIADSSSSIESNYQYAKK